MKCNQYRHSCSKCGKREAQGNHWYIGYLKSTQNNVRSCLNGLKSWNCFFMALSFTFWALLRKSKKGPFFRKCNVFSAEQFSLPPLSFPHSMDSVL